MADCNYTLVVTYHAADNRGPLTKRLYCKSMSHAEFRLADMQGDPAIRRITNAVVHQHGTKEAVVILDRPLTLKP
jgi:hypothetical protein